ncbi:MAG: GGDEF domain-containing protein [Elainellaceae cyanobacterium]
MSISSDSGSLSSKPDQIQNLQAQIAQLEAENQLLQYQVVTDDLTGIYNRRGFNISLSQEWRRCIRRQEPMSLILIDIDHFRAYNDQKGRAGGDMLLRHLAQVFISIPKRAGDIIARYGDDEFACILSDTDGRGADILASTMRARANHAGVSISTGIASTVPSQDQEPELLVEAADGALHRAKQQGHNQVVVVSVS